MISPELPEQLETLAYQARMAAEHVLRPISRRYDAAEHEYPVELDTLAELVAQANAAQAGLNVAVGPDVEEKTSPTARPSRNGRNLASLVGLVEMCWGDVALMLTMPNQGLGQAAIQAAATPEQLRRFGGRWAAMAITEPEAGSDSAAIRTTAVRDGDEYVLNGEKIYVTSGSRAELVVVWATLDRRAGRGAIKSFVVERDNPGMRLDRLEDKLGIRASDTANLSFVNCRVPAYALLGSPEISTVEEGFARAMRTLDNTRPLVAGMAVGVARAALDRTRELFEEAGLQIDYDRPAAAGSAAVAEFLRLEADWEASRLLALKAAWMADNRMPNTVAASIAKAKAGRMATDVTLRCVALCGASGYGEDELLEKWSRDAKILDIFEGTQQIQQLVIARQLLGKRSDELR